MKISGLVKKLNAAKKEFGDIEILISCDEEGNGFNKDVDIGWYDQNRKIVALYPYGDVLPTENQTIEL